MIIERTVFFLVSANTNVCDEYNQGLGGSSRSATKSLEVVGYTCDSVTVCCVWLGATCDIDTIM